MEILRRRRMKNGRFWIDKTLIILYKNINPIKNLNQRISLHKQIQLRKILPHNNLKKVKRAIIEEVEMLQSFSPFAQVRGSFGAN